MFWNWKQLNIYINIFYVLLKDLYKPLIIFFQHFQKTLFSQYEGDPDRLFNTAFAVKYSAKKMKK